MNSENNTIQRLSTSNLVAPPTQQPPVSTNTQNTTKPTSTTVKPSNIPVPHHLLPYSEQQKNNLNITSVVNPGYICKEIPMQHCRFIKDARGQQECMTFWKQCCEQQQQ